MGSTVCDVMRDKEVSQSSEAWKRKTHEKISLFFVSL